MKLKSIIIITLFLNLSNILSANDNKHLPYSQEEKKSKVLNLYGDEFKPTNKGYGVDISSQRQDELDLKCLAFIREATASKRKISAVELGGGFGKYSLQMVMQGASVIMVDIGEMAKDTFNKAFETGIVKSENLTFIQKDFRDLNESDIPENIDLIFSQRSINYIPYVEAKKILQWLYSRLADYGSIFISAAGWDTEYGKTYPDRNKPIEERFNFIMPDMQQKHGIMHKIVTYKKEDMTKLLKEVGFSEINVTCSAFGNIKATARKMSMLENKWRIL